MSKLRPVRFLAMLDRIGDRWEELLDHFLIAFEPHEAVSLVLGVPADFDVEGIAEQLEQAIAGWGYDLAAIPDIELTPLGPGDAENLRRTCDHELESVPADPGDLRKLAGRVAVPHPPLVSIVILAFNQLPFTRMCLESVRRHTRLPHEVLVVDNASSDGTADYLRTLAWVRTLTNAENLGYGRGCNQGLSAARGRHVVLLNNDTLVTAGWLERMLEELESGPDVGMVGPVSNYTTAWQLVPDVPYLRQEGQNQQIDLAGLHHFARERALRSAAGRSVDQLAGFCMLIRREVLERIGGLDPRYGIGYFEDSDYAFRARIAGFDLRVSEATFIHHFGSRSFEGAQIAIDRLLAENGGKFKEKWGLPAEADLTAADIPARILATPFDPARHREPLPQPVAYGGHERLTSIVILGFNQLAYTQICIESIQKATSGEPYELILVDNGSSDGTTEYFRDLARRHFNVRSILNPTNLGFAGGCNQGLIAARGDRILLLNNDTLVTDGWLERLCAKLDEDPSIGIVGPVSNYVNGPQLVPDVPYGYDLAEIAAFSENWAREHAGQGFWLDKIVGFCMLIRREVVDRIGGFDTRFGNGNFEDDDYSLRARVAGFRLWVSQDVFIHHFGSRTFMALGDNADYRASMDAGWALFKERWRLPPESPRRPDYDTASLTRQAFDPERHVFPLPLPAAAPRPLPLS